MALIEGRSHALIESNTFPFLNGLAHFVPNSKLSEVTEKLKDLEGEFWKAKEQFIKKYGALRESASKEWEKMARKLVSDPERLVATIESSFPTVGQMDRYFGYDIQLFQIAVPERLGLDMLALGDQEQLIQARQTAAQQAAQKIRSGVETFVADCVATLREQTAQLCQEMLQSINTCETGVHQKTLNRLVKFVEQFKTMNFVNDADLEQQLENVRKELLEQDSRGIPGQHISPESTDTGIGPTPGYSCTSRPSGCHRTCSKIRGAWAAEVQPGCDRELPAGGINQHLLGMGLCRAVKGSARFLSPSLQSP